MLKMRKLNKKLQIDWVSLWRIPFVICRNLIIKITPGAYDSHKKPWFYHQSKKNQAREWPRPRRK